MADIVKEIIQEQLLNTIKYDLVEYEKEKQYDIILTSQLKEYPSQKSAKVLYSLATNIIMISLFEPILKECYLEKLNLRMNKT